MTILDTFKDDIVHIDKNMLRGNSYSIEISITSACNFRCSYCMERDSCYTDTVFDKIPELFSLVDGMLVDDWFLSNYEQIKIGFWGGEPTIRPDIIKRVVDRYKDDHMISFFIYTNGYNCDDVIDIFDCVKHKTTIQVSYDGGFVNEKNRRLVSGEGTSSRVRDTIFRLVESGFNVHIKSTITYDDFEYIDTAWDDIKCIHDSLGKEIRYAVTVDYSKKYDMDMEVVKRNFLKIAKREKKFFKENGYHLFTWFDGDKKKCQFAKSGMAIDTNGDLLYCHGCMYSPKREDMVFGYISDSDVVDKIKRNHELFVVPTIESCDECVSTNCMTCNVVKYINSNKEGFLDRWYDLTCQKEQCDMFREFGKIHRALRKVLGR